METNRTRPILDTTSTSPFVYSRHSVVLKYLIDLLSMFFHNLLQLLSKLLITSTNPHCNIKNKRHERLVDLRCHRHNAKRDMSLLCKVAGERTPNDREVN